MPAFKVPVDDQGGEEILFYASLDAAKEDLDDEVDTDDIEAAPEFDRFESQGKVPLEVLVDAGWYHYCDWCERRSDDEEDDEDEPRLLIDHVFRDPLYFCCPQCSDAFDRQRAKLKADRDTFVAEIYDRWNGLTLGFPSGGGDYDLYVLATFEGGNADIYKRVKTGRLEVYSAHGDAFNRLNPKTRSIP